MSFFKSLQQVLLPNSGALTKGEQLLLQTKLEPLVQSQMSQFAIDKLKGNEAQDFQLQQAQQRLHDLEGREVVGVDIGGDKIVAATFRIQQGKLAFQGAPTQYESNFGEGYLPFLKQLSEKITPLALPVGISIRGPVDGTHLVEDNAPNIKTFAHELKQSYDYDFKKLLPTISALCNDSVAGMHAAIIEATSRHKDVTKVFYLIIGSGFGGAAFINNQIITSEFGHAALVGELNTFSQTAPCLSFGAKYVCLENVTASKKGVEDLWQKQTSTALDGKQISQHYQEGDTIALSLYDNAARVAAHAIEGMRRVWHFPQTQGNEVIVCHGGIFKVPGFGKRLQQYVDLYADSAIPLLLTKDFSDNACLDGAAIAAAIAS